jgi:hypothetical protein
MMMPRASHNVFSAGLLAVGRFDFIEIATIAVGVMLITALSLMF